MKNIHTLSTDKPTWLHKSLLTGILRKSSSCIDDMKQAQGMNIYITSDEEIKESDDCLNLETNVVFKMHKHSLPTSNRNKKIILTTDQDLIKDGVQAIPDEFLEWFVSKVNDSGKSIDIVSIDKIGLVSDNGRVLYGHKYKIVIPKEEPKQEVTAQDWLNELNWIKSKQETLEEAIKKYPLINQRIGFKLGVKWQQERSYSFDELRLWLIERDIYLYNYYTTYKKSGIPMENVDKYIEDSHEYLMGRKQFKKK